MSRFSKLSSIVVACSAVAVLAASVPGSAFAKGGGGSSMGGFHSTGSTLSSGFSPMSKNVGNFPISKNVGNFPIGKNIGSLPISKIGGSTPSGKIGSLPISKTPISKIGGKVDPAFKNGKFPLCNPCGPDFCHHHHCCNPCWHWSYPWLLPVFVEEVVCLERVYSEPLYTLFYETADGIKVYSRYELPSESATLYKTEHVLDKANTAWWLVSSDGQLVDTNTAEKVAAVKAVAASE
jgi:hypothetical protein